MDEREDRPRTGLLADLLRPVTARGWRGFASKLRNLGPLGAAERPFRRVIGVEFAEELVEVARSNILRFRNGMLRAAEVECVQADARGFALPDGPCVLYFYSPFEPEVFDQVLAAIERDHARDPRPMLLVYCEDREGDDEIPVERRTDRQERPLAPAADPAAALRLGGAAADRLRGVAHA